MSSITMLPLATIQQEGLNMQNKQDRLVSGINIKTINEQSILGSGNLDIQSSGDLTKLSAEVSGLVEKIENLPSAESSLFEVVYGETPYNDIIAASKARKHVICYYKGFIYNLTKCQEGYDLKFSCADMEVLTIICKVNGGWSASNAGHEVIMNKVTSLSDKSTNVQYPSAKAVYDALQNVGGGSSVFEAVYGVTTYDEIVAAVRAQKHVICFENARVYNLNNFGEGLDLNFSCAGDVLHLIKCTTQNKWSSRSVYLETTSYKVQSLSDKSTIDQYPSAKAVYDFVNNTLGTIINGDY